MMPSVLRVSLAEHGGFVPRWRVCDLDLRTLPADEAATLRALVEASGIMTMTSRRIPGACDIVTYRFEIETSDGTHTVALDGPMVPEPVRPLLQHLLARSRDALDDAR